MNVSNAPISFPGLFGDWQFTVPSKALDIGNGIYFFAHPVHHGAMIYMSFLQERSKLSLGVSIQID